MADNKSSEGYQPKHNTIQPEPPHGYAGTDFSSTKDFSVEAIIDINGTIKGLKAVQREAKKATAALKELEGVRTDTIIFDEMHSICLICGGANREITEIKTAPKELYARKITCLDCGYDYV